MENRRRYPRYETEFEARIYAADLNLSVTVVDISEGGIGIISENPIETGSKVSISLYLISEDPIIGIPVWSIYLEKEQKYYYRIGIETENLAMEKIKALGFPKRSKFVSEILSQIGKAAQRK